MTTQLPLRRKFITSWFFQEISIAGVTLTAFVNFWAVRIKIICKAKLSILCKKGILCIWRFMLL